MVKSSFAEFEDAFANKCSQDSRAFSYAHKTLNNLKDIVDAITEVDNQITVNSPEDALKKELHAKLNISKFFSSVSPVYQELGSSGINSLSIEKVIESGADQGLFREKMALIYQSKLKIFKHIAMKEPEYLVKINERLTAKNQINVEFFNEIRENLSLRDRFKQTPGVIGFHTESQRVINSENFQDVNLTSSDGVTSTMNILKRDNKIGVIEGEKLSKYSERIRTGEWIDNVPQSAKPKKPLLRGVDWYKFRDGAQHLEDAKKVDLTAMTGPSGTANEYIATTLLLKGTPKDIKNCAIALCGHMHKDRHHSILEILSEFSDPTWDFKGFKKVRDALEKKRGGMEAMQSLDQRIFSNTFHDHYGIGQTLPEITNHEAGSTTPLSAVRGSVMVDNTKKHPKKDRGI